MKPSNIFVLSLLTALLICFNTDFSKAQVNNQQKSGLGLGVILGEPTGASVKYWLGNNSAFDVGAAWSLTDRNEALHMHTDFLWHSWLKSEQGLAFYYGVGARAIFADDAEAGLRVPLGLTYLFESIPLDLFLEAVPILDIAPEAKLAGNGGVGLRYYF
jgi:hypothetical protein